MGEKAKPADGYEVFKEGEWWCAIGHDMWSPYVTDSYEDAVAWTHEAKFHESGVSGT